MLKAQHALKVANETSGKLNKVLNENRNKYEKEKAVAIDEHQAEIKALRKNLGKANKDLENLKKELKVLDEKDAEIEELKKTNLGLEEKLLSLLDTLYGCEECGYHGDYCTCNVLDEPADSIDKLSNEPVSDADCPTLCLTTSGPSETSTTPTPPPSTSTATPWTPPATPPCSSCGGENYGPCPDSVCFGCISPLKIRPVSSSSPSRTPPGTPPPLQGKHWLLGNMPAKFRGQL